MFDGDGVSPHLQDPSSLEVLDPFFFCYQMEQSASSSSSSISL